MTNLRITLDRRSVLLGGLTALGAAALPASVTAAPRGRGRRRNLVLVQLSGGNDGLSTVVPYADDRYHELRPNIRHDAGKVRKLDDHVGLHPDLVQLRKAFDEGRVALVQGAGYPRPNRSHFKSFEIWHTAHLDGRLSGDGWVGKLVKSAWSAEATPETVVHVGPNAPYSLFSNEHPPVAFTEPMGYRWIGDEEDVETHRETGRRQGKTGVLADLRKVLRDAQDSSARIRYAASTYEPRARYANDDLSRSLASVAAMIQAGLETRVYSVTMGGFDTHAGEKRRHDGLMRTLDRALASFQADLLGTPADRDTLVLVFSEFGRRVKENGSQGTDHGTAGPMFVLGAGVRGGLYGAHPSLEELDKGDLVHTTDFRRVYADLIGGWFGADPVPVVGEGHAPLGLLA